MYNEDDLQTRLKSLPDKRWRSNEMYNIVNQFLVVPLLPEIIERHNALYLVKIVKDPNDAITSIDVLYEREKKSGFFNRLIRFLISWKVGLRIWYNKDGQMFVCEYYRHSFFSLADQIKEAFYDKLYKDFNVGFVVVDKAK